MIDPAPFQAADRPTLALWLAEAERAAVHPDVPGFTPTECSRARAWCRELAAAVRAELAGREEDSTTEDTESTETEKGKKKPSVTRINAPALAS